MIYSNKYLYCFKKIDKLSPLIVILTFLFCTYVFAQHYQWKSLQINLYTGHSKYKLQLTKHAHTIIKKVEVTGALHLFCVVNDGLFSDARGSVLFLASRRIWCRLHWNPTSIPK